MAPEVLLKYGHDFSVDYWAIGVLIYELTQGEPPFKSPKYIMKVNPVTISVPVSDGILLRESTSPRFRTRYQSLVKK